MILYKPVLIETAEQAEALPIGTVTIRHDAQGVADEACLRVRGGWHVTGLADDYHAPFLVPHRDVVGDVALVPIEAEEETERFIKYSRTGSVDHVGKRARLATSWVTE